MSGWSAVAAIFNRPRQAFEAVAESGSYWPAYLTQMGFGLLTAMLMAKSVVSLGGAQGMGAVGTVGAFAGGLVGPWVAGVVLAAVAAGFGAFAGGGVSFRSYFAMVGFARIPCALGALITALLVSMSGAPNAALKTSLSPAALLAADASPALRGFLMTLNPFDFWYYALLAIGFATLHRTRETKAIPLVALLYLFTLVTGIISAQALSGL